MHSRHGSDADRLVRQIEAIDAWNSARVARQQACAAATPSGEGRADADLHRDVLRRVDAAVQERTHRHLAQALMAPFTSTTGVTAVIAHNHPWFAAQIGRALGERRIAVIAITDNGTEALGVVIAEQPDVLLVSETLSMLTGEDLVADAALFAPETLLAAQVASGDRVGAMLDAGASTAFVRQIPPAEVADALCTLLADGTARTVAAG